MKRIALLAILLFPVVTLIAWVYWGTIIRSSASRPTDTNVLSLQTTNATNRAVAPVAK